MQACPLASDCPALAAIFDCYALIAIAVLTLRLLQHLSAFTGLRESLTCISGGS